jgi:histone acetyltransferase
VACDTPDNMGPIKENGRASWYARDCLMLICNLGTKRKATEEPNTPSDSKRIKSSNSEEPETTNIPKAPSAIPFPEKVR